MDTVSSHGNATIAIVSPSCKCKNKRKSIHSIQLQDLFAESIHSLKLVIDASWVDFGWRINFKVLDVFLDGITPDDYISIKTLEQRSLALHSGYSTRDIFHMIDRVNRDFIRTGSAWLLDDALAIFEGDLNGFGWKVIRQERIERKSVLDFLMGVD